ncbi:MFS transporter [Chelatococcus reniformis]|uniref:MFS transporter n=1 Tax=Chelatococcus reniformis TaxID=1494448 RepID=A0A916USZ5_9HYPH|nr:MFS transporter [Chelatococcus reniformis]GGC85352.1 MFS transporter [Chelatococcus reniformis]
MKSDAPPRHRLTVIAALGVVQILAWGSSFYLLSVLATPIAADTAWPIAWIVGGLSVGLIVAGLVSPRVGTFIGRHGGRPVLAASAAVMALGLVVLGLATSLAGYVFAWVLLGLGMGTGLYDAAFATLGRLYGDAARPSIGALTLWGGFASTVSWPVSAVLIEHVGWRGTCFAYAGLQLAVALPLVVLLIPPPPRLPSTASTGTGAARRRLSRRERRTFWLMASIVTLGSTVTTLVSVHLLVLLQARGVALASAVSFGALIGPAQVGARVLEMAGRGRHHPLWTLTMAMGLIAIGVGVLALGLPAVALALILYGAGNGIYSIARGTVPLALFGAEGYAPLMGRLARPGLVAAALAPLLGAFVLAHGGADVLLTVLAGLAAANAALVGLLWRATAAAGSG